MKNIDESVIYRLALLVAWISLRRKRSWSFCFQHFVANGGGASATTALCASRSI